MSRDFPAGPGDEPEPDEPEPDEPEPDEPEPDEPEPDEPEPEALSPFDGDGDGLLGVSSPAAFAAGCAASLVPEPAPLPAARLSVR